MAELLLGRPLFAGASNMAQLSEIVRVLGLPTLQEWPEGALWCALCGFPDARPLSLARVMSAETSAGCRTLLCSRTALQFLESLLAWNPRTRCTAAAALASPMFAPDALLVGGAGAAPCSAPAPPPAPAGTTPTRAAHWPALALSGAHERVRAGGDGQRGGALGGDGQRGGALGGGSSSRGNALRQAFALRHLAKRPRLAAMPPPLPPPLPLPPPSAPGARAQAPAAAACVVHAVGSSLAARGGGGGGGHWWSDAELPADLGDWSWQSPPALPLPPPPPPPVLPPPPLPALLPPLPSLLPAAAQQKAAGAAAAQRLWSFPSPPLAAQLS
jgi:hypothetical protein